MKRKTRPHRNRLKIINDILTIADDGAKKTHIMYRANLSYDQLTEYLDFLLGNGLIAKTQDTDFDGSFVFRATDKGKEFLRTYSELQEVLQHSGEEKPTPKKESLTF